MNPPTLLANAVNNDTLCKGKSGWMACDENDKKAFECNNNLIKCTNIRFTSTGVSSYSDYCALILAGVELFGYLSFSPKDDVVSIISYNSSLFFAMTQSVLMS